MQKTMTVMLVIAAIIHLLPLQGMLGGERLSALYGVHFDDPNTEILMRHRAVMFGLFGMLCLTAAFWPTIQPLVIGFGLVTTISFVLFAQPVGDYNTSIQKVVLADVVAIVALIIAAGCHVMISRGTAS